MIIIKKNKNNINVKTIIISTVIASLFSCISSYAASKFLYESKEVRYNNTSTKLLTSASDVQTAIDDLYSCVSTYDVTTANSGFHNSIFRGKDVTEYLTSEYSLYDRISDGTFTDLYVGDYVIVNDITWRIAGFDMRYNKGDGTTTTNQARYNHHAVIVPDTNLTSAQMNTTNTTKGGYMGSVMYKTTLSTVLSTYITPVFGNHILTYYEGYSSSVNTSAANRTAGKTTGASNVRTWAASRKVDLMNEAQVFGTTFYSSSAFDTAVDNIQFPLFRLKPEFVNKQRTGYWLRDVASSALFVIINAGGDSGTYNASTSQGIRPCFYIG